MESNQLQNQQYPSQSQYLEEIDFQKYWLVLKRRWLPAVGVLSAVVALSALQTLTRTPIYQANGKLLFQIDRSSTLTGIAQDADLGQVSRTSANSDPLITQAEIVRSKPVISEVIEALDLRDDSGEFVQPGFISGRLKVTPVQGTDILKIEFRAPDPELAAAVVDAVMEVYITQNVADNRAEAIAAREFIQQQLPIAENAVSEAETALRNFKEENQIVALDQEATNAVATIADLDRQISESRANLVDTTTKAVELRRQVGMSPEQAADLTQLNQAPGVQTALTNLQEIQAQLSIERTRYRDTYPTVANLVRQEESLSALLEQRITEIVGAGASVSVGDLQLGTLQQTLTSDLVQVEMTRLGLEQRLTVLVNTRNALQQQASAFPGLEKAQRELERQLLAAQTTYEALLKRLQEIRITENQNIGNARILEAADVPALPLDTGKKSGLIIGLLAGSLLAIASAFFLDLLDKSVKTAKDARELLGYTLLGIVPKFSSASGKASSGAMSSEWAAKRVVVLEAPLSPVSKAYQMVQANIQISCSHQSIKTLVVSSSVAAEGKSEVCANLAAAMAQVGHRVLLVDANMHDPAQHHFWSLSNAVGLSNVIVNHVSDEAALQPVAPNLAVLTAGVIQSNPLSLISSQAMRSLIEKWSKEFDFVLFDTPALSGNAEAVTLSMAVDGLVFVVRPRTVMVESAKASREFLQRASINVIGMVANGVYLYTEPNKSFYYVDDRESNRFSDAQSSAEEKSSR